MTQPVSTPAELDQRFAIAGRAHVAADPAGNAAVRIITEKCSGEICLHGAHVTSWKPASQEEVIFLSSKATFADGKAIRGGIPICFPWFRAKSDDAKAPAHGFARTKLWTLEAIQEQGGDVIVTMSTESDDATRQWWPHEFRAQVTATFGHALRLEFTVSNTGATTFRYEEALHTYYRVGDISQARLAGLDGVTFLDNTDGNRASPQSGDVAIAKATDRAYLNTEHALELIDAGLRRRMRIDKKNSASTVVWNPWSEAAAKMPDMGEGEWRNMFCAEACNILANAVELAPGETHSIGVTTTLGAL
jgi:glucose-6-phosphate 1-epimerase